MQICAAAEAAGKAASEAAGGAAGACPHPHTLWGLLRQNWKKYATIMFVVGLVGDVFFFVGGYYAFTSMPTLRIFLGQVSPELQHAFYMLLHQYKGQDFVLACREADEEEAANVFSQAQYAHSFTRREWYKLPPVFTRYNFYDEQDELLRQQAQQQQQQRGGGKIKRNVAQQGG